eukprot:g2853.t1
MAGLHVMQLTDCSFSACEAEGYGGGMHVATDWDPKSELGHISLALHRTNYIKCHGTGPPGSTPETYSRLYGGGGIGVLIQTAATKVAAVVSQCTFSHNTAGSLTTTGFGGGIYFCKTVPIASWSFIVTDSVFSHNSATVGGGAMIVEDDSKTTASAIQLSSCRFNDNTASYYGGVMWFNYLGSASNSSIVVTTCKFSGNTAGHEGGAFYISFAGFGVSVSIVACTFTANQAALAGGAFRAAVLGKQPMPTNLGMTVINQSISGPFRFICNPKEEGLLIPREWDYGAATLLIDASTFSSNVIESDGEAFDDVAYGGAIYAARIKPGFWGHPAHYLHNWGTKRATAAAAAAPVEIE